MKRPEPDARASHLLVANPAAGTFVTTVFRHAAPLDRRGRTNRPTSRRLVGWLRGCGLAGLPNPLETGTSALALDPARPRERTYAHYSWGGRNTHASRWYDVLHLFSVNGRVTDPAAWRYRRAIFEPADDRAAQRGAHRIGLWADEDAAEQAAGRRTYVTGEYAAFFVPADTGRVTFDVRKAPALAAQTVTVRVDGRVVDRRSLTDDAWRTLDYAVEARDADNSPFGVELLVGPAWRDADDNLRGVLLRGDL